MTKDRLSGWFKRIGLAGALYMGTLFKYPNPEEPKQEKPQPETQPQDKGKYGYIFSDEPYFTDSYSNLDDYFSSFDGKIHILKGEKFKHGYKKSPLEEAVSGDKEFIDAYAEIHAEADEEEGTPRYKTANAGHAQARQYTQEQPQPQMRHLNPEQSAKYPAEAENDSIRGRRIIKEFFYNPMEEMKRDVATALLTDREMHK